MNIFKEIKNLQRQMSRVISNMAKDKKYTGYDLEASRTNTAKAQKTADEANEMAVENEGCIIEVADIASENDGSILDLAEIASENDGAILELAKYISSLEERIKKLEGGNL